MREIKLIEDIRKQAGRPKKGIKVGIGDDCAVLDYDKKHYLLWATDMLVEGTHFRKDASYSKVGRKAVAVNISDIASMGGKPKYITVSLGVRRDISYTAIKGIYKGIFDICKKYGISVVGGDTNRSAKLIIDVSIMGLVEKNRLVTRSGADPGDIILITGPVRDGKKKHMDFIPRIKEARYLVEEYKLSSMIDVSDGIAIDAGRVCSESRVGCGLYADKIPLEKGLGIKDALYYGESFELLFTMKSRQAEKLLRNTCSRGKKQAYYVIGEIIAKRKGMNLISANGRSKELKMRGYEHV